MRALTGARLHHTTSAATATVSTMATRASQRPPRAGAVASHGHRRDRPPARPPPAPACPRPARLRRRLRRRGRLSLDDLEEHDRDVVDPARHGSRRRRAPRPPRRDRCRRRAISSAICSSRTMSVSPSEQIRYRSPGCGADGQRLDLDARLGADRARDHRPVRVLLGLLGRQPSRPGRARPTSE